MPPKLLLAGEVAEFTDAELDQYLEASRLPNGDRMVEVEDPDNLPESFIQRLRERARPQTFKPVDLDQVSARLLQPEPTRRRSSSTSSSSTSCSVTSEELYEEGFEMEKKAYHELASDGGRPFYPIELLPDLSRHPEQHPEILRYWSPPSKYFWHIFTKQKMDWQFFRDFQKANRYGWKGQMARYQTRMLRFLEKYSIQPPSFEFKEDWTGQDRLTDWIEYACYTCFVMRMRKWDPLGYELKVAQLGWITDQIPLIQAEMRQEATVGTNSVKRNRTEDDEVDGGEPLTKKQKALDGGGTATNCQPLETVSASPPSPDAAPSEGPQSISPALGPRPEP
ncbi:hypothetical protein F5144DRAFT_271580 [Chaetomium tenue]|uniref:Uncharacterized protein n=1 Tax=Chaetomium tenue TaxID=1854479 RepID=A0ACB7P0E0_9PEZI|nr:hypothetical protein F5144DRAFT_271580 [Chaetomium globosum]